MQSRIVRVGASRPCTVRRARFHVKEIVRKAWGASWRASAIAVQSEKRLIQLLPKELFNYTIDSAMRLSFILLNCLDDYRDAAHFHRIILALRTLGNWGFRVLQRVYCVRNVGQWQIWNRRNDVLLNITPTTVAIQIVPILNLIWLLLLKKQNWKYKLSRKEVCSCTEILSILRNQL